MATLPSVSDISAFFIKSNGVALRKQGQIHVSLSSHICITLQILAVRWKMSYLCVCKFLIVFTTFLCFFFLFTWKVKNLELIFLLLHKIPFRAGGARTAFLCLHETDFCRTWNPCILVLYQKAILRVCLIIRIGLGSSHSPHCEVSSDDAEGCACPLPLSAQRNTTSNPERFRFDWN